MKPLRIGVDARELLGDATGVGRYLGELMRRWTVRPDADRRQFLLYAPAPLPLAMPAGATEQRTVGSGTGTWWEQTALRRAVKADRPDVFFAPAYTAPLGLTAPLAVTIHDISFTAHPEWFRTREGIRRRWLTHRTAHAASVIFTDSEFSRREIETRLGVPPSRIQVIAPGVNTDEEVRSQKSEGRVRAPVVPSTLNSDFRILNSRQPVVLYVGSLFNRRRLPQLIAGFAKATVDMPSARLVIVGADRTWPPQDLRSIAESHGVSAKVELKDFVRDDELASLYSQASVFAFLSEYEGFGLTPLEAMAAGTPAVVLDTAVAREVYGDAAEYVQADDVAGTAAALRRYLTSPEAGATLLARAPAVLARYSWERAADRTLEHLERIAAR